MNVKLLLIPFLVFGFLSDLTAQQGVRHTSHPLGTILKLELSSAPFPHPKREKGYTYKENFFSARDHYRDSTVMVFIPDYFEAGENIDFLVHFHGWYGEAEDVITDYHLVQQLHASCRNAVLVVPQGPLKASDSFGGKMEDPNGFSRFITDVLEEINAEINASAGIGNLVISGHSGGYHAMAFLLANGGLSHKVKEAWLFDALYGQTEKFRAWMDTHSGKLVNIYTRDGGTFRHTKRFVSEVEARGWIQYDMKESELPIFSLPEGQAIHILTPLTHGQVVNKSLAFYRFLRASQSFSVK